MILSRVPRLILKSVGDEWTLNILLIAEVVHSLTMPKK